MKAPVVDCSVTMAWVLADEESELADSALKRVTQLGGAVPALWWAEIRNVLLIAERRNRITPVDTEVCLAALGALRIRLDDTPRSAMVLRLARNHGLTAYDAMYLELAVREGRPLATLDNKLVRAATAEGIEVLEPPGAAP